MSREIIELVHELERDRGIEGDTLIVALEDALLAAYKKTPGSSRHAVVVLDRQEGDFRVFSIELPSDIEERLLEEARERVLTELEEAEVENGEKSHVLVTDDDLDIDWSDVPEDQVRVRGPGDRRRPRGEPRRRARARLPLENRGRVARPGRRPCRRVRRPAWLARAHGRLRAPRREDRHHPVEPGAGAVRRQGALARARARGLPRRRCARRNRRRAGRPTRAC